jgi:hypothetical protein
MCEQLTDSGGYSVLPSQADKVTTVAYCGVLKTKMTVIWPV